MPDEQYNLTLAEASGQLNRSEKTIRRYVQRGLLHPIKVDRHQGEWEYRFSQSDLEDFKRKQAENDIEEVAGQPGQNEAGQTTQTGQNVPGQTIQAGQDAPESVTTQGRQSRQNEYNTQQPTESAEPGQTGQNIDTAVTTQGTQSSQAESSQASARDDIVLETIKTLRTQLETKDRQIEIKDRQIEGLQGTVNELLERSKESNYLLGQLQSKFPALNKPEDAPIVEAGEPSVTAEVVQEPAATEAAPTEPLTPPTAAEVTPEPETERQSDEPTPAESQQPAQRRRKKRSWWDWLVGE